MRFTILGDNAEWRPDQSKTKFRSDIKRKKLNLEVILKERLCAEIS